MARQVKIAVGKFNVKLPDGGRYDQNKVVNLTEDQFALLSPRAIPTFVIDEGNTAEVGSGVGVKPAVGKNNVVLPNGGSYNASAAANLTLAQYKQIPTTLFPGTVVNTDDNLVMIDIPITLNTVVNGTVSSFVPGYAGKVINVDFVVLTPVTTTLKTTTLSVSIGATPVTGGVVTVTSATATPASQRIAGTAVTAANTFLATDTLNLIAASTTAFVEGTGFVRITAQRS